MTLPLCNRRLYQSWPPGNMVCVCNPLGSLAKGSRRAAMDLKLRMHHLQAGMSLLALELPGMILMMQMQDLACKIPCGRVGFARQLRFKNSLNSLKEFKKIIVKRDRNQLTFIADVLANVETLL